MSKLFGIIFILALTLPVLSRKEQFYLLTDWHPEHGDFLSLNTEVVSNQGRVQILKLKKDSDSTKSELLKFLRPINLEEVKVYSPQVSALERNPLIDQLLTKASKAYFQEIINSIVGFENRSSLNLNQKANSGNEQAQTWFLKQLSEMGYIAQKQCYADRRFASECNVLAEKSGETEDVVLIVAHLDDVGYANAGADDNASGAAALLTMAKALSETKTKFKVQFLLTNGEEINLNGSRAFVELGKREDWLKQIRFVINMDMVAYNQNGVFEIETNANFESQALWYSSLAKTYTSLQPEITIPAWGSDHVPFLEAGIPSFLTIEDWQTKTPCYHRSCDKVEKLNVNYAMEIVKLNLAAVAEVAMLSEVRK